MTCSIAQFYSGRSVLLTGGLGFIGKQIVEKLLRSCPEVENVYLLVRQKKGQSVEQRLKQALQSPVFGRLRHKQPNFHHKVVAVAGDLTRDFLGISDSDHSRVTSDVSIVIHSAATVNFLEPLRVAVDMNVLGVKRMLSVCKELPKLDALVHVSTAFAHIDKGRFDEATIEEKVYDPPVTPDELISVTRKMTDQQLEKLTPQLLKTHRRPNTYIFTKAVGENLIEQEHGHVPCCIVRPTVVSASYAEPFPGWLDNFYAANGLFFGIGVGFIRSIYTTPNSPFDIIPVDMVANAVIASAWHISVTKRTGLRGVPVYNLTNEMVDSGDSAFSRFATVSRRDPYRPLSVEDQWTIIPHVTSSKFLYHYLKDVYLPVRIKLADFSLKLGGKNSRLLTKYQKAKVLQEILVYFTRNGYRWSNNNTKAMFEMMNEADKKEFNVQMSKIDLQVYYSAWWQGIKKYMLQEKVEASTKPINEASVEGRGEY